MLTISTNVTTSGLAVSSLLGEFLPLTIEADGQTVHAVALGSRVDLLCVKAIVESGANRFMVQVTERFIGGERIKVARVDPIGLDVCSVYLG